MPDNNPFPAQSPRDIGQRGEAIYKRRYQAEFEKTLQDRFVAIDVVSEEVTIADTAEEVIRLALEKSPTHFFHLLRIDHQAAFDAGWYMSCGRHNLFEYLYS